MLTRPISTANADHYSWGGQCDGWHLVRAQAFSVIEERMPSGTSETKHWHARSRQFFYVLSGTMTMAVEGVDQHLPAGHGIEIKQGLAHQVRNESPEDLRFLVISSPPHQGDRREAEMDDDAV
jgi:mannose-6-phosphate isomerase-like protein (cupin superfamily)